MKTMKTIVSWSGGKDSTASIILAHEHNIQIDEIVIVVLWFDKLRGIPAILPEHWQFITEVAIPIFENWGYKVRIVNGKRDYITLFHKITTNSKVESRNGKKGGWLISGRCKMTNEKQEAIRRTEKEYADCLSIQGIAVDEPERLERLHKRTNAISLLEEYNITEKQAKELCEKYGLLSPLYKNNYRDGCWFCPNARISELAELKKNNTNLYNELEKLSNEENLVNYSFRYGIPFEQINKKVIKYINRPIQLSLF